MKHLYKFFWIVFLTAFTACSVEVDDIFDEPASERIRKVIEEDLKVLQSAPNGWLLEYYPSVSKMYGGYTLLLSFDEDGNVEAACDVFANDKVTKSLYKVQQSTGPVLTFDTYNEIIHLFSAPSNIYGIGDDGKGMEGDAEFLILECTADKVVLKGKKTGTKMTMVPMPESKTWKQYLNETQQVGREAYMGLYDILVNGEKKYTVTQEYHCFVVTNEDGSQENLPFVYTPEGIKFYEPVSLGNSQTQSLAWDHTKKAYTDADLQVKGYLPTGYKKVNEFVGTYKFYYNDPVEFNMVTLEEVDASNPFVSYLRMKGFEDYEFLITYDKQYGRIGLVTQTLSSNVALLPWALDPVTGSGNIFTTAGVGLEGINSSNTTITFQDNGVGGNEEITSMIIYDLVAGGALLRIPYISKMVKQ